MFLLTGAVLVGAVSLAPGYIALSSAISELTADGSAVGDTQDESPLAVLTEAGKTTNVLLEKITAEPMTDLIVPLLEARTDGIQISSITFDRQTLSFSIRGVAETRESLVAYRRAVEDLERVQSVTSPIANLARNTNLEFTLSVVLHTPSQ